MKIMAPDDPTSVYPIGQTGLDDDEEDSASEDAAPVAQVPPIEPEVDAAPRPAPSEGGGFNPLIALAVLGMGMVLAAMLLGLITMVLLVLN